MMRTRWTVYGSIHPMFSSRPVSYHRWRWTAALAAWWYRQGEWDAESWVKEERISWLVKP